MTTDNSSRHAVYLGTDFYQARVRQIQSAVGAAGLDGLLILDPANLMWATGFFHIPNERPIGLFLPAVGMPTLFVPFLEKENAEAGWIEDIRWYLEYPGDTPAPVWMLEQTPGAWIGVDSAGHRLFEAMRAAQPGLRIDDTVARLRTIKAAAEIELTRIAAAYADFGLTVTRQAVTDGVHAGITELDVVQVVQAETTDAHEAGIGGSGQFLPGCSCPYRPCRPTRRTAPRPAGTGRHQAGRHVDRRHRCQGRWLSCRKWVHFCRGRPDRGSAALPGSDLGLR